MSVPGARTELEPESEDGGCCCVHGMETRPDCVSAETHPAKQGTLSLLKNRMSKINCVFFLDTCSIIHMQRHSESHSNAAAISCHELLFCLLFF